MGVIAIMAISKANLDLTRRFGIAAHAAADLPALRASRRGIGYGFAPCELIGARGSFFDSFLSILASILRSFCDDFWFFFDPKGRSERKA